MSIRSLLRTSFVRRLVALLGVGALLLVLTTLFGLLGGASLLSSLLTERSDSLRNSLEDQAWRGTGIDVGWLILKLTQIVILAVWSLFAIAYLCLRRHVRWRYLPLLLLGWYLAAEVLAGPVISVPLQLTDHYYARDTDHWPTSTDPDYGWNEDSLRTPHQPTDFSDETVSLVFLGDSFTFGLGVDPEQVFPSLVERWLAAGLPDRDVKVVNFAWPSASPLLSLRRLERLGPRYHPDHVVMCLDMTDFFDDIRWGQMIERRGIYRWWRWLPLGTRLFQKAFPKQYSRTKAVSLGRPPNRRFFVTEQPLEESREDMQVLVRNLDAIHRWCKERGIDFLVLLLPRSYQYNSRESPRNWEASEYQVLGPHCLAPFRFFAEVEAQVDYPIESLLPAFRDSGVFPTCFVNDPHWNPAGHQVAARGILPILAPRVQSRLQDQGNGEPEDG
jgi:hypothetical protein